MKKTFILTLLLMMVTTLFGCNQASKTLNEEAEPYLNTLIILPEESYNEGAANQMINRLLLIPSEILDELINQGVKIKLTTTNITGVPEYAHLSGVTPRGWSSSKTWDDVPGIGGNPVVARIGYSNKGKGHGSINLELHETAHGIDNFVFNNIAFSDEFKEIQRSEKQALFGDDAYFDHEEEYFAESFAMFYLDSKSNEQLKTKAPKTHEFINHLSIEE